MTLTKAGALALCGLALAALTAGPAVPAAAQRALADPDSTASAPNLLRLDVTRLAPSVVTAASDRITMTGTVTNTGDRKIDDVQVRLQLADPVATSHQLATAMRAPSPTASYSSRFVKVATALEPGQSAKVDMAVPLGSAGGGLGIPRPGVYPLTVNVNGEPAYGGAARLASLNVLLPVRAVPGKPSVQQGGAPFGVTALWPIEENRPSQIGTTVSGRPVLADDDLAGELRQGGRLADLVAAGAAAARDPQVGSSVCFAVDPAVVALVNAMGQGYQVRAGSGTRPGSGAGAARSWLAGLVAATKGHCVLPIPYADADLVALARAGTVDLERLAVDPTPLRRALPGAKLLDDVVWPADGMLDQRTLGDLTDLKETTALLSPPSLRAPLNGQLQSIGDARALTVDPLVTAGLRGSATPSRHGSDVLTPADCPAVANQNGIAALVYLAQFADDGDADGPPSHVIAAPPRRWNASAANLTAWTDTLRGLVAEHAAFPEPLGGRLAAPADSTTTLTYPGSAASVEIPRSVTGAVRAENGEVRDLVGALQKDTAAGVTPLEVTAGLQQGLLRAVSGAWRGNPAAARTAAREAADRFRTFTGRVSIGSSRLPINLASKDSQLPVSVSNALPVNVQVRIYVSSAGLTTANPYLETRIPAQNSRTFYLPVTVRRSGRFNVDIRLTTPGQTTLGDQVRLDVSSSAFGVVTLAITGGAFAMLILLSGRRVYRRVRAARTEARTRG